jgi:hypothetical protein
MTKIPDLIKDPKLASIITNILSVKNICIKKYGWRTASSAPEGIFGSGKIIINSDTIDKGVNRTALVIIHEFLHHKFEGMLDDCSSKQSKLMKAFLDPLLSKSPEFETWSKIFYSEEYYKQHSHYEIVKWFKPILGNLTGEEQYSLTHKEEFYPCLFSTGTLGKLENKFFKKWYSIAIKENLL